MIKKPRLVNSQTITIYRHGEIQEENHFILMNPTSNFKIVAIKKDRYCEECSKLIKSKSRCYTINPKNKGRMWVCFDCMPEHGTKKNIKLASELVMKTFYILMKKTLGGVIKLIANVLKMKKNFMQMN